MHHKPEASVESNSPPIRIWNRTEKREEVETIYGDAWVRFFYEKTIGKAITNQLLSKRFFSQLYGFYQSSSWSRHKISPFIKAFSIPMEEYQERPFSSFNDFFIRKFKPGKRPFLEDSKKIPAFCEGRYLAYESLSADQTFPVKGGFLSPARLLRKDQYFDTFLNGPMFIARLCPTDYHWFHFPDSGKILDHYPIHGKLHSVNPIALGIYENIFVTNERQVSILKTQNFGQLAYIEIGALCVGKIVQTHPSLQPFVRGQEKGYFLFGASTVVLLGEPRKWKPSQDLLDQTSQKRETLVRLGEEVGTLR